MPVIDRSDSKLFTPLTIGNGALQLSHRVVHAPLTRCRGIPVGSSEPCRDWMADELLAEYYTQRATPGGLIITEALAVSVEAGATPGIPGIYLPEQAAGWKKVVDAVHAQGAYIYAQIWHGGRTSVSQLIGKPAVSASAVPITDEVCPGTGCKFEDDPPREMTVEDIKNTVAQFVVCAKNAIEAGFDGIELHGANGYLLDQFLNDNINKRTDDYGGSPEKRCRFVLELVDAVVAAIGQEKVAIRLTPFGLFNQTRGSQRLETWGHLCREIKRKYQLSYVHFIEPRYEQIIAPEEKEGFLTSWGLKDITLDSFREIMGDTPFFSAGGWNHTNSWGLIESGKYDALVYGRYFLANPDFIDRLRKGLPFNKYDRNRFYGPFPEREPGYIDYPRFENLDRWNGQVVSY
ncbi:hypothetical protein FN846DRAFT_928402 [Sphaerosporella brunnea]|uniref:NADH:flavin oxidoreductase/NADH oxidase N-terminal domain-containing protein n=1 Tax=Sphaerosporella brunnea TaxID=1250544 RepID=A0A5J5FAB3_9PEZI|nr:hypothetical protein FN846DRAFT_928402 [Sphaerosporella brunnea]